ncbi:hypothetical protein VNO78_23499 [Psophocarpus tetragonolobus]|uniref:Uncharacterized protein n=1 Tax=Psophocarpus tetragonolobus TaxID=3891 RepID=A0AAN9S3B9_PSOTE
MNEIVYTKMNSGVVVPHQAQESTIMQAQTLCVINVDKIVTTAKIDTMNYHAINVIVTMHETTSMTYGLWLLAKSSRCKSHPTNAKSVDHIALKQGIAYEASSIPSGSHFGQLQQDDTHLIKATDQVSKMHADVPATFRPKATCSKPDNAKRNMHIQEKPLCGPRRTHIHLAKQRLYA